MRYKCIKPFSIEAGFGREYTCAEEGSLWKMESVFAGGAVLRRCNNGIEKLVVSWLALKKYFAPCERVVS